MQEWHLLLNSGRELIVTCESAEITKNRFGEVTNIHWNGIKDNIPIRLNLESCECVYYKTLEKDEKERDTGVPD